VYRGGKCFGAYIRLLVGSENEAGKSDVRCRVPYVGIADYDHTRPSRHERSSRSRSGDREKSQTPESSGRPRLGAPGAASGRRTPVTPATAKKAGAGSKGMCHQVAVGRVGLGWVSN